MVQDCSWLKYSKIIIKNPALVHSFQEFHTNLTNSLTVATNSIFLSTTSLSLISSARKLQQFYQHLFQLAVQTGARHEQYHHGFFICSFLSPFSKRLINSATPSQYSCHHYHYRTDRDKSYHINRQASLSTRCSDRIMRGQCQLSEL